MTQHILQLEVTSSNEQSASQDFRLVGFLCGFCWWWRGRGWPEKFSEKLAPEKCQRQGLNRLEPPWLPPIIKSRVSFGVQNAWMEETTITWRLLPYAVYSTMPRRLVTLILVGLSIFCCPLEGLGSETLHSFFHQQFVHRWRNGSKTLRQDFRCILRCRGFQQKTGGLGWSQ